MGTHKTTNKLAAAQDRMQAAGALRVQQRMLEKQLPIIRTALIASIVLLVVLLFSIVWPPEQSVIGSSASNIFTDGLSTDLQEARDNLESAQDDPLVRALFSYLEIDDTSLNQLRETTITPSDENLFAFTRRATARSSETSHANNGQLFFDSPFEQLVTRPNRTLTAYTGTTSVGSNEAKTGMSGRSFWIIPEAGTVLIEKKTDGASSNRIFRSQPNIQPGGSADIFIETTFTNGSLSEDTLVALELPDGISVRSVIAPRQLPYAAVTDGVLRLSAQAGEQVGGNQAAWTKLTIAADESLEGNTICLNASVTSHVTSSLFSDTACLSVVISASNLSASCIRQQTGKYRLIGQYAQITDPACLAAFADAPYEQLTSNRTGDSSTISLNFLEQNLGSNSLMSQSSAEVSDLLEYAALSNASSATLSSGELAWVVKELSPGESMLSTIDFTIDATLSSAATAASDAQSFDRSILVPFGSSLYSKQLDRSSTKTLEQLSNSIVFVPRIASVVGISTVVVVLTIRYAHSYSVLHSTKRSRNAIHGGSNS